MKILIFGANGQVGQALTKKTGGLGDVIALGRAEANLTRPHTLQGVVQKYKPDVIINAAAYTAVDKAEAEEEIARTVNATAPGVLAEAAKRAKAWFIHYSTDYVFDGDKAAPYTETDTPNPLNIYGRTKLEGERAVEAAGGNYLIFRTSWVYSDRGANFIRKILSLAKERDYLSVVDDQVGSPTSANLIATVTSHAVEQALAANLPATGLFHLTASGETNWHTYAQLIVARARENNWQLKLGSNGIKPAPSQTFSTVAKRPKNSRLSTQKLREFFKVELPAWERDVLATVDALTAAAARKNSPG